MSTGTLRLKRLQYPNGTNALTIDSDGSLTTASGSLTVANGLTLSDGDITVPSPHGIFIGGTGTANKLEDYEEGSWTPALSSGGSSTYDNAHGRYTKIGRFVACHFTFEVGSTVAGGTTQYLIGGLPFTRADGTSDPSGSGFAHYFENLSTNTHALTFRVDSGQSVMYISGAVAADGATGLSVNHNCLQVQSNIYGSVFYYTNT